VKAYYHARAHEYDDWWLGRGSYAERDRPGWDDELAVLVEILRRLPPARTLDGAALRAELGDGRILREGHWFVAVSA